MRRLTLDAPERLPTDTRGYIDTRSCIDTHATPLCPALTSVGRKRKRRPWDAESPPPASRNGSVLGVVWEVPDHEEGAAGDGDVDMQVEGKVGTRPGKGCKEAQCASKYDADVVRGVLFPDPEPEPVVLDVDVRMDVDVTTEVERMDVDSEVRSAKKGKKSKAKAKSKTNADGDEGMDGDDGEGEEAEAEAPPRKRRRVSGLDEVYMYAAALEEEGAAAAAHEENVGGGEKQREVDEKMLTTVEGADEAPMETDDKAGEPEPKIDGGDNKRNRKAQTRAGEAETEPRDLKTPEELKWDVSRVGKDGTREVLHQGLGKDGVEFVEGGVRFHGGQVDDGEQVGVAVLWRYGSGCQATVFGVLSVPIGLRSLIDGPPTFGV
ncbi:hypothetical protein C8R45DRAFT_1116905 [Mycena sanguinolenta]|nr:hypothetical protein C8R45DRAFT_1116905 [Mycena sanguinolenta]